MVKASMPDEVVEDVVEDVEEVSPVVEEKDPTSLEDLDPEEELWEGGPKIGKIIEWKEQHGDVYVTSLTLDKHVVWRTMDRGEYKQMIRAMEEIGAKGELSSAEAQLFQEDYIAELAVLYPPIDRRTMNKDLAGLATIIAQEVMDASGFVALEVRQL